MARSRPKFSYKIPPPVHRGRKVGQVPFLKDKKRFHAVLAEFLRLQFSFSAEAAFDTSIMLLDAKAPFQITQFPDRAGKLSGAQAGLENRSDHLDRTCGALLKRGFEEEKSARWIQLSLGALFLIVKNARAGASVTWLLNELHKLGWDVVGILTKFGDEGASIPMATPLEIKAYTAEKAKIDRRRQRQISAVTKKRNAINTMAPTI